MRAFLQGLAFSSARRRAVVALPLCRHAVICVPVYNRCRKRAHVCSTLVAVLRLLFNYKARAPANLNIALQTAQLAAARRRRAASMVSVSTWGARNSV